MTSGVTVLRSRTRHRRNESVFLMGKVCASGVALQFGLNPRPVLQCLRLT